MRSNIMSFNLLGIGCSAGITSAGLARDLLRVHQNLLVLIVSTEMTSHNWYTEQLRYVVSLILQKMRIATRTSLYTPDFKRAFEHFSMHTGGKAVI
ncbi:hypothetical protein NC651_023551 [Populus alba x Populus x berolinensis]|nr:hypothetical protein NC651_023551 [Populus alba x Populus x berolinensis]